MTTYTVTDDILSSPQAEAYFQRSERRIQAGFRAALELLGLPLPGYAQRRAPGPRPSKAIAAAYAADNPAYTPLTLAPRKPDASPERIAALRAKRATPALYDQTFAR